MLYNFSGGRAERCKYDKGAWSDCDVDTNTKTRILTRKGGDESTCEATKTESKPCGGRGMNNKKTKINENNNNNNNFNMHLHSVESCKPN